ncbi:MAG: sulfur oxidation c-type cytochrome SoxA [Rhodocyclales bacterium]|nr:sulfur oxidation c-type cytochrome SoxA [Rhodocyclales bacterium]
MKALALSLALLAAPAWPQAPRSGLDYQGEDIRRLQADDFANPAMLWVERGAAAWTRKPGATGKSCADCHGAAEQSMRGLAARLPAWDARLGRVSTLEARINACIVREQQAPEPPPEAHDAIGLQAYIALQSRGMPLRVEAEGAARPLFERGRELYGTRMGQMNLACTHCHEQHAGKTLLVEKISQGQPTAWPAYRMEWQAAGSLERRLRACFLGVRAEMPAYRSDDLLALQLFLARRAQGLALEAPGVRR